MDFDFGEVLRRAWQITWKHKALWVLSALPILPVLFFLPVLVYVFLSNDIMNELPKWLNNPTSIVVMFTVLLVMAAISLVLQLFSSSATTFGVIQVEAGNPNLTFREISRGGRTFFWRIVGTVLLVSLATMVFFAVFSACLALVGFVTFGLGSILGQVLLLPVTLLAYAVTEQAQIGVVAGGMRPTDAIMHALDLVSKNLGVFALVTIVLYFALSIVSSIATLPVMAPLFLAVFSRFSGEFSNPAILWIAISCFVVLMPVYLVVQAVAMLYRKSVHVITYLRLMRSSKWQPLPGNLGSSIVKEST